MNCNFSSDHPVIPTGTIGTQSDYRQPRLASTSGCNVGFMVKKVNHNATERDRRKKINSLYSSLRSLLPQPNQAKKLSIPSTIYRVFEYIPDLQVQIRQLTQEKERFLSCTCDELQCVGDDTEQQRDGQREFAGPKVVSTSRLGENEALVQICQGSCSVYGPSRMLLEMDMNGLSLMNASSFKSSGGKIFHDLHLRTTEGSSRSHQVDVTMVALGCCDISCRALNPRTASPSAYSPPPPCGRFLRANLIVRSQVRVEDVMEIAHNKVLVAAAVSGAIGQLAKPFTRVFLNGNNEGERRKRKKETAFDLRAAVESGGFPSTHSSAVTATATSLLLERGFADSIFGLSVVYAALVMYDAQGVRREVGKHAKVLNKRRTMSSGRGRRARTVSAWTVVEEEVEVEEEEEMKEGVGHTEVEVAAGALLGICVSLFLYHFI
ncbi:hypothetical protein MLD38_004486 [Melastoma candidum]|uniref:Uncharacterized protein n=1 Tax=Melastoma candidum TaxID=119954 RepID=A0ACB9S5J5_9MYRT|nr:hypothetical protein MLD38_004486 [Melastoma candidum]